MPKVKFEDGTVINFEGTPTQQDIDEAYNQEKASYTKEQLSSKIIPQITKGLYEGLPFGKRIVSMLPQAEKIKAIQEATPQPKGILPSVARFAGEVAPDIAMMTPFIGATSILPKVSPILKLATGIGTYAGTKAGLIEGRQRILPEAGKAFATTAALGYAGKGLIRAGKEVGKGIKYLKKSAADYVTTKVAPKAYQIYQDAVNKFTPQIQKFAQEKLKIPPSTINSIKKFGINTISKIRQVYNDTTDPIVQKIEQGFVNKRNLANTAYQQAISSFKGDSINSQQFYQIIQRGLRRKGWVDLQGNPTNRYKGGLDPITDKLTDLYIDMRNVLTSRGKKITGQIMSKQDFSTYRDALSGMLRDKPSDILIMQAKDALYNSAEKSGMAGINVARNLEAQAFKAERELFKKSLVNQNKLNNFQKLTETEKRQLKLIEQYTGEKFVNDLDAITADRALDKLREYNPDRFVNDLNKAIDPKWTEYIKKEYRDLLGDKIDDIFKEIVSHRRGIKLKKGILIGAGISAAGGGIIGRVRRNITEGY